MARIDFALWDAVGGYSGATRRWPMSTTSTSALAQELELGLALLLRHRAPELAGRPHHRADRLSDRGGARHAAAAHRRDDVAAAVLSPDPAGAGSRDARPALARPRRVRHRHRRARARVHPLGRRLLPARRDRRRGARDRQDGLDPGRGHLRGQVLPVRRGAAAAEALSEAVSADLGRGAQRRRRSSSPRATTTTSPRTSTPTRWSRASSTSIARSGRSANHPGPMPRVFLQRQVHVAETDEKAHEEARQYLASPRRRRGAGRRRADRARRASAGARTRAAWAATASGPTTRRAARRCATARAETTSSTSSNGLALVGSPETVIRKLEEGKQQIGYDIFCTNHEIGRMPTRAGAQLDRAVRQGGHPGVQIVKLVQLVAALIVLAGNASARGISRTADQGHRAVRGRRIC